MKFCFLSMFLNQVIQIIQTGEMLVNYYWVDFVFLSHRQCVMNMSKIVRLLNFGIILMRFKSFFNKSKMIVLIKLSYIY